MNRSRFRVLRPLLLGVMSLSLLTAPLLARAAEEKAGDKKPAQAADKSAEKKAAATPRKPPASEVKVYTNADLERLFGGAGPAEPAEPEAGETTAEPSPAGSAAPSPEGAKPGEAAAGPQDPAAWLAARQAKEKERQQQIDEAQSKVDGLRARIAELEKRALAVRNPFLPRPEVSDDDRKDWDAASATERASMTDAQLAEARKELEAAERELTAARSVR